MNISVIKDDMGNDSYTICRLNCTLPISDKKAIEIVHEEWNKFQKTHPETDALFASWMDKIDGFNLLPDDDVDVIVE